MDWNLVEPPKEEKFNEVEFQKIYKEMATKKGLSLNPDDPLHYYDYRALYKETGKLEPDETGHFPSKYKLEGHPNMIVESINTKTGKPVEKEEEKKFDWGLVKPPKPKVPMGSQFGGNWGLSDLIKKEEEKEQQKKDELLAIETKKKQLQATYELFTTEERKKQDIATKELFGKRDTGFKLEQAPEEKKTFFSEISKVFKEDPTKQLAKAQVSYNISQKTGMPIEEVHKNLDKVTKDLGIRGIPTSEEFLSAMFVFPVTAALISNPITTGLGVGKFLALAEAENFAISKLKKWDYKFGEGKGIKELLPEDTNQLTKDMVDVADFLGKGLIIAKTDPKLRGIWKKFTEKISTEYKMPEKTYISAEKVKSIFQTGEKINAEEAQLIRDLGLNASQYKSAIKKGIDIEIPASKITTITDRPYWAKLKGLLNIKSVSKTVISRGGKVSPAKLMIEGKGEIPQTPVVKIPEVKPIVKPVIPTEKVEVKPEIPVTKEIPEIKQELKPQALTKEQAERVGISQEELKKYKKTILPKADVTSEQVSKETIDKLEALVGKETTPKEVLKKVEEKIAPKEELKAEVKEPVISKEDKEFIDSGIEDKKDFLKKVEEPKEKLITPEGTVSGEKGSIYIPSMKDVQNIGTKIASKLSIEAPFIKVGAKETGFQVKNYYSNIGLAHDKGLKEINDLNKFNFKLPTVKESGFKVSGEIDYTDITYLTERPGYFVKLTPEERKAVSPAKRSIKEFYKEWEDKLREMGWLEEPFPKSLITRNTNKIKDMKLSLPRLKTPEAKATVKAEIDKLQDQIDRIKKQKIQFVSIPAKLILAKAETDPALHQKIMSILPHWGRKTITVKDLVEAGIMTRKEADIRYIIGEYSDRMGRKLALGKIFENAEKEGLIKSQAEKPDWATPRIYVKGQHVSIPQLRGKRLDPFFSDVMTDFFSRGEVGMGGAFGLAKMLQFYNPLFMPMYDVWQSAVTGTLLNIKAPKYIAQGIKDTVKKTDNYWSAYENGTFSKPFVIPYDKWEYQFTEAMKGNKIGEFLKKAVLPTNWIPMSYTASWHTAWKLDETIRMMTFNYLKDKGMSDREAGQLAALFHSDYASVPPKTRKTLNKVLFTPTFKITMSKLYLNMFKGIGHLATNKKINTEDRILARGAWLALAGMMGISLYFKSQGYEEVEKFRKYVKEVETDEGLKENVITLANPFNIPWRYYYRIKGAFKPQTTNVAQKLLQIVKWDLHPVWRIASDVVDNYNYQVYNPFDSKEKIALDIALYTTGKIVKITEGLLESAKEGEIKADAFKALQKDLGQLEAIVLKPFIFNYIRETKNVRKGWAINKLQKDFKYGMLVSPSKDPKENYKRVQNYNQRMKEIMEDFQ